MSPSTSCKLLAVSLSIAVSVVFAETHTVHFDNMCGFGTPTLVSSNGQILSNDGDYTVNGPLLDATAYLQTGNCAINGQGCTVVQTSLQNGNSSTVITTISPYTFSLTTGFVYYNGCDGAGEDCPNADCLNDYPGLPIGQPRPVSCSADNVNLAVTFCD